ncbi:MAG: glucosaminidase domain-containing protein [Rhodospirillales bacterium]|nr:glucosaminidase domain-containing protein [Rhodospirillales bacterium]
MTTLRRMFGFERFMLVLAIGSIAAFSWLVYTNPLPGGTASPRAPIMLPPPIEIVDYLPSVPMIKEVASVQTRFTVDHLDDTFEKLEYDLNTVKSKSSEVPRFYLASLPEDMSTIREVSKRKALFFKTVLPLVLKSNEDIRADRRKLWKLHYQTKMKMKLDALDQLWLLGMSKRYGVKQSGGNAAKTIAMLLERVDTLPVSLALAQAAEESGWGTSRFAKEGNALFGQWTYKANKGITPKNRDEGATHSVKAFPSLGDAVGAYMRNLNTHRAYRKLRKMRAVARRQGEPISGYALAAGLNKYSARGAEYVASLRSIIVANELSILDGAILSDKGKLPSYGSVI